ncbi:MAG: hypothetical protein ACREAK_09175, partial [Nitrosarchaeum sp.]
MSKKEQDYLSRNLNITKSYERVLKFRIREKLKRFFEREFPLLEERGITEFYNGITKFNNGGDIITQNFGGEEGIRTPIDRLCRPTHNHSA